MKTLIILLTVISAALTGLRAQGAEPTSAPTDSVTLGGSVYMKKIDEADKACNDGKWFDAERAILDALKAEPTNPSNILLLSNLGMIRYYMGLDSLAIETLNEAHEIAPASVTILANRARIHMATGNEREAYNDYSRIIRLDSLETSARLHHCLLSLRRHDFRTAQRDFGFMERNSPSAIETQIAGAAVLSGTGQYQEAIPYYSRVIKERKERGILRRPRLLLSHDRRASGSVRRHQFGARSESRRRRALSLPRGLEQDAFPPGDAEADARKAVELGVDKARAMQYLSGEATVTHHNR